MEKVKLPEDILSSDTSKENQDPAESFANEKEWLKMYYEPELKRISEKLDRLLIRTLELTEEYMTISLENETYMREGYINMAKSRYIMGPQSVSRTNLPTEMDDVLDQAYYTIITEFVEKLDLGPEVTHYSTKSDVDEIDNTKIRKRFGLLTPQSLKKTQHSFQSSLNCIVQLANISAELELTRKNFEKGYQEKKTLLNSNYASFRSQKQ